MFYLIGEFISSILWGALIAIALIVILWYLPKLISTHYSYSAPAIILLVIAFLFISFQSTLLVGGIKAKKLLPSAEQIVSLLPVSSSATDIATVSTQIANEYPILKSYINDITNQIDARYKTLSNINEIAAYYYKNIQGYINSYMWRRIMWMAGCIILVGLYLFNSAYKHSKRRASNYDFDIYS